MLSIYLNQVHTFKVLGFILLCALCSKTSSAQICEQDGNLVIFSNYEGGTININCDVNIVNLKIGIVTYESPVVNFTGAFANQITEVIYAGFGGNGSCTGNTDVQINGVDPSIVTIYTNAQPAISPYLGEPVFPGFPALENCIVSGGGCSNSNDGGGNSSNQIVQFFLAEFSAPVIFRAHFTQYECWANIDEDISTTGNCCLVNPTTPLNPIYQSPATYDLIPETEFSLCDGPVTVFIPYEVLFQPPAYPGYVWSNGATGQSVTFTEPGIYSVTAGDYCHFDANGLLEDVVEIVACNEDPDLLVDVLAPSTVCEDAPFQIEGSVSGGVPPYVISWNPNFGPLLGPFALTLSDDLFYSLTVTDAAGNTLTVEGIVAVEDAPQLDITGDFDLCDGQATLTAESESAASYLWSTGATTPTITIASSGTYSVTATSACGSVSDNVFVGPCTEELTVEVSGVDEACAGENLSIQAVITGGVAPYSIVWNQGLGTAAGPIFISPFVSTNYTVTVNDAAGNVASASLFISVIEGNDLALDLGPDIAFCADLPQTIGADVNGALSYAWSNGAATPFIEPTVSGIYSLQVSDLCSSVSDEIEVTIVNTNALSFGRTFQRCEGESLRIGPSESNAYSVIWNSGEFTDGIVVLESGVYGGAISDLCGTNDFTIIVDFVNCDCDIYIPNAFTPDNNGFNDLFGITTLCKLKNYQLLVFDRWGQEVFSTNNPELNWNGSLQGDGYFCKAGVYAYFLSATQDTDLFLPNPIRLRGSVTLIR
jgi:gliding motility-associated-like protein